jgi:predicted small lipoprotein YifL
MESVSFFEHPLLFTLFSITGYDTTGPTLPPSKKTPESTNKSPSPNSVRDLSIVIDKVVSKEDLTKESEEFLFAKTYDLTEEVVSGYNECGR